MSAELTTPMLKESRGIQMSELKEHLFVPYSELQEGDELTDAITIAKSYYIKSEVDEAIAELKAKLDKAIAERDGNQVCLDALNKKLEDVQATAYAESVDAGMSERRLRRALWLARLRSLRQFSVLAYFQTIRAKGKESNMDFDEMAYRIDLARIKCRAKAEEYK